MDTNQPREDEPRSGELLVGADVIKAFLIDLGMPSTTDPYYLRRAGWPIGSTAGTGGGKLIASKRRLARHTQKLAAPRIATPE